MTEGDQEQAEKVNEAATNGPARARGGVKGGERGRGTAVCSDHVNDHYKVGRREGGGAVEPSGLNGALPEGLECVMIGYEIGTERKWKGFGT